ncbi:MAG: DHHA1 domain-containing protein, partial [Solirubrobacteraceae bacterium]
APRLNAAGRLYRADSALELLLTEDEERAAELADELDHANSERRDVETRIRFEAEALVSATGPAAAYVLAGTGWHPGVIGIVAARIAQRHHRPAVMIAIDQDPAALASGSGRSIPAFDLLGGLGAAAEHLERHGGHRAAAGLSIDPAQIDAFRAAFVAHAESVLTPADLMAVERVDAVASGEQVGLELAEELAALAPFGAGNPQVSLLLAAATFTDPVGFGGERRDQHTRFTVTSGGARARAVCFGSGPRPPVSGGEPVDATFTLERNEWQGMVEPRLLLRAVAPCDPPAIELRGEDGDYLVRVFAELDRPLERTPPDAARARLERDRRGHGVAGLVRQLVATGEPVLVVCADAVARARHLQPRLGCFALASHDALERGALSADGYRHVMLLDPPSGEAQLAHALCGGPGDRAWLAWGAAELRFAVHIHEREYGLRDPLAACYRALRDRGGAAGRDLEEVLRGEARSPELAGRLLRVLTEVDLVELDRERSAVTVTARPRVSLDASAAYREYERRRLDGQRYLESRTRQAA